MKTTPPAIQKARYRHVGVVCTIATNHSQIQWASSTDTSTKFCFKEGLINTFRHGCAIATSGDMKTA